MLEIIRPQLSFPELDWGQTTKEGGVSSFGENAANEIASFPFRQNTLNLASHVNDSPEAVRENWRRFDDASNWSRETIATCQQVHGSEILEVHIGGHHAIEADALISRIPGLAIGVFTADCVPIIVADPKLRHVAAIHCGWKGVAANLAQKTIAQLSKGDYSAVKRLLVWIGAAIQVKSYEVGHEVAHQFDRSLFFDGKPGKFQLDLPKAVHQQLVSTGILEKNIEDCKKDTYTLNKNVFSHRADGGKTGRMMTFVGFLK